MVDTLAAPLPASPRRGLGARLIGVVTSPRAAYAEVAANPAWFGAFLVILVASVVPVVWILSTALGQQAAVDQQLQTLEAFGRTVTDEEYRRMLQMAPYSAAFAAVSQLVLFPVTLLVLSGMAFAVFNGVLGDDATFRQVFAVVTFSSTLLALRSLFATPLNYARESLSSPTNLAAVLPVFDDGTFAGRLFAAIDLFLVWWAVSLAIGLGVLYKRRTAPIALTILVVYGAIALTIAAVRSVLAGA